MQAQKTLTAFDPATIREFQVTLFGGDTHEVTANMMKKIIQTKNKDEEFFDTEQMFGFRRGAIQSWKKIQDAQNLVANYTIAQQQKEKRMWEEKEEAEERQKIEEFAQKNPLILEDARQYAEEMKEKSQYWSKALEKVFIRQFLKKKMQEL